VVRTIFGAFIVCIRSTISSGRIGIPMSALHSSTAHTRMVRSRRRIDIVSSAGRH
jgi:hypothetical protein